MASKWDEKLKSYIHFIYAKIKNLISLFLNKISFFNSTSITLDVLFETPPPLNLNEKNKIADDA